MKRLSKKFKNKPFDSINLTPVLDVVFTILIAFILIAPYLKHGIVSDIPHSKGKNIKKSKLVTISITSNGEIFLEDKKYSFDSLKKKLIKIHQIDPEVEIYLEGSKESKYGYFVKLLAILKEVGFKNINIATKPR